MRNWSLRDAPRWLQVTPRRVVADAALGQASEATGARGLDPQRRAVPRRIRGPLRSASLDPAQEKLPRDGHWFTHDWGCPVLGPVQGVGGHRAHDASFSRPEDCTLLRLPRPQPSPFPGPRPLLPIPYPGVASWLRAASGLACIFSSGTSW